MFAEITWTGGKRARAVGVWQFPSSAVVIFQSGRAMPEEGKQFGKLSHHQLRVESLPSLLLNAKKAILAEAGGSEGATTRTIVDRRVGHGA